MRTKLRWNRRKTLLCCLGFALFLLLLLIGVGTALTQAAQETDFSRKNLPPSLSYPFGTDWMGRNMLYRTLAALSLSIRLGLLTAAISSLLAFVLGVAAAVLGRVADAVIGCAIDLVMGIPHILLLLLISVAMGRGLRGVIVGIALTHWTSLARVLRAEALQIKESPYVRIARKLGKGPFYLARKHMALQLLPQLMIGAVLLFPHAILHEASITFLGFGLSDKQPAIGVILSESMQYLAMGRWWLAVFPGALLVLTVLLFYGIGNGVEALFSSGRVHQ
ncbi:MAG: ABC transporter permease [bacterium]|nr:ABC transporter permease [bacterium]